MGKVIGVGEIVTDIIIRDGSPQKMVCGGSCLNTMVTLGRCGVETAFVSQVGDDYLGHQTKTFLAQNGVNEAYVVMEQGRQSKLSLAVLNEHNDANYEFYGDKNPDVFPAQLPPVEAGDIVVFGSYYALNPALHEGLTGLLRKAKEEGSLTYYDVNFRPTYLPRKDELLPNLEENLGLSTIVRGSDEDFQNLFGTSQTEAVYERVKSLCKNLLITRGSKGIDLRTASVCGHYDIRPVEVVSTIGAGDTFNAGVALWLYGHGIDASQVKEMTQEMWGEAIMLGAKLSAEVCQSTDNYVSKQSGAAVCRELQTIRSE